MIKVFVVDDSAVVRQTLQHLLQGDPEIELAGQRAQPADRRADDPQEPARRAAAGHRDARHGRPDLPAPDDGRVADPHGDLLDADRGGQQMALDALAAGAVAVVAKPRLGLKQFLEDSRRELVQTLKAAARSPAPRAAARDRAAAGRRRRRRPPVGRAARAVGEQAGGASAAPPAARRRSRRC